LNLSETPIESQVHGQKPVLQEYEPGCSERRIKRIGRA
jgi:hypothetical protein